MNYKHVSFHNNSGVAKVVVEKVNRGVGYVLEIPRIYTLHGPKPHIKKVERGSSFIESQRIGLVYRRTMIIILVECYALMASARAKEARPVTFAHSTRAASGPKCWIHTYI